MHCYYNSKGLTRAAVSRAHRGSIWHDLALHKDLLRGLTAVSRAAAHGGSSWRFRTRSVLSTSQPYRCLLRQVRLLVLL